MVDEVQVCETFVSIQGESTYAGMPCFFIRLAGCNLRCSYCDTTHAFKPGKSRRISGLVKEFRASGLNLVQVTGGEPLLQPGTLKLLRALCPLGTVLLETNGSLSVADLPKKVIVILDIKCPGSGESETMDWNNVRRLRPRDEVKFVVIGRADYVWARKIIRKYKLWTKCNAVLLGPVYGKLNPAKLARWMLSDRLPARLNLQLHKYLSLP